MIYNLVKKGPSEPYTPPTWAGGTDAEIVEALTKHYNNEIDLTDYWSVGDERSVTLSAMSATGVGESHASQTVTFVLANVGGKTLETAINGHTECAFVWEMKECLNEPGYIHSSGTNGIIWNTCDRRTWCNNVFYSAMPSYMQTITKTVANVSLNSRSSTATTTTYDKIALPSSAEIGFAVQSTEGSTWTYHSDSTALAKTFVTGVSTETNSCGWWTRTAYGTDKFYEVYNSSLWDLEIFSGDAICVFGCI